MPRPLGSRKGHSSAFSIVVVRDEINVLPSDSFFVDSFSSISFLVIDLTGTHS